MSDHSEDAIRAIAAMLLLGVIAAVVWAFMPHGNTPVALPVPEIPNVDR